MAFPTQKLISDHGGAEILITSQNVLIKKPDRFDFSDGTIIGTIPGESVEVSMNDIHNITKTLQEEFGVDIRREDFRKQFKC